MNHDQSPDEVTVQVALGGRFVWYEALCDAAGDDFEQEWKFYGKKYGWKLKVHDYLKTLFELTVEAGAFRIGLAVREKELQAMRQDPELSARLGDLLSAEKFAEGWGIRLLVDNEDAQAQALALVAAIAGMRDKN